MFFDLPRVRCALGAAVLWCAAPTVLPGDGCHLYAQESTQGAAQEAAPDPPSSTSPDSSDAPLETAPETTVVGQPQPQPAVGNQPPQAPGNPTVITPTRIPTPANQSGSSLTVITREQIEQSQRTYVVDLLRQAPGVDVVQSGTPGGVTSVFRGKRVKRHEPCTAPCPARNPGARPIRPW